MIEILFSVALLASVVFCWIFWARAKKANHEVKQYISYSDNLQKQLLTTGQQLETIMKVSEVKDDLVKRGTEAVQEAKEKVETYATLIRNLNGELSSRDEKIKFQQTQYDKLLNQKKSSEVRVGFIAEQIAPFMSDFPYDSQKARFVGDPIDLVCFEDDKVVFVEVKSGKSQLNKNQRNIRDLIEQGKVEFFTYRISGDGNGSE